MQTLFQEAVIKCEEADQLGLEAAKLAEEEERLTHLVREKEGENRQPMLPLQWRKRRSSYTQQTSIVFTIAPTPRNPSGSVGTRTHTSHLESTTRPQRECVWMCVRGHCWWSVLACWWLVARVQRSSSYINWIQFLRGEGVGPTLQVALE